MRRTVLAVVLNARNLALGNDRPIRPAAYGVRR